VTARWPERLQTDRHCLIVLERVLLAAAPEEGCALLLGRWTNEQLRLQRIWPCRNSWEPVQDRCHRFQLDPREQLLAQKWCRQRGLQVIGAAHSHPSSAAVPSRTDLELCFGPTLMLIHSGLGPGTAAFRAWWIPAAEPETPAEPWPLALDVLPAA
jgi:proteasome lid subunit RPN8/RPN11